MTPEKRFLSAYWKAKQAPRSEEGNHSDAFSRFASEAATWIKDVESAAFNAGLEEAAKIAEAIDPEKPSNWLHRRENIAAAIRRLSEEDQ